MQCRAAAANSSLITAPLAECVEYTAVSARDRSVENPEASRLGVVRLYWVQNIGRLAVSSG